MIAKPTRRLIALLIWPPSRAVAAMLAWSHRRTVALWARSLGAELQRRPIEMQRLSTLVRTLWKISTDPQLNGGAGIRSITVDTDVPTTGDQTQRGAAVRATLLDVPGVVSVEIADTADDQAPLLARAV